MAMKSILVLLYIALGLTASVEAQQAASRLDIKLNKNILQPGDSLFIQADYKDSGGQLSNQSLATLEIVIENEAGQRTRLRWPVIDGQATGTIFLPDSLRPGKYTLVAGLQQRFFEVIGQVKNAKNIGSIQAMLLTKTGDWDEQKIIVAQNGTFAIRNWLFEDNALLAFHETKDNRQSLNISISSQLDSSYQPLAVAGRTFYIGNPPAAVRSTLDKPVESPESLFTDRGTLLPAVIVKSIARTPSQQFDEQYVSGLFRSGNERLISVMDDPSAVGSTNIFNYLQGRVAGLQIAPTGVASWRGGPVTFFLDETRVSAQQIANIPITDIAIVKAYPPPFFGAPGGSGGVAIYTRRGGEASYLPSNRQVFKIRGYTPSATALDMNKLRM
ncbi:hypothetical protein LZZ85_17110 [Terrimonas sp. NA20]|uniref:TonB-dependent receptor plug domain-containing protein n=1 Tax=Terrimonas ginsenosidimutans TaxID=2908004 RepID=A0ABS9KUK0_9BACT|nr:hypothetical protein [Terrimonas ginsenosidimutans]MCG2616019.1 hypothetical protein [Terrimonas ginsenosidimutans]